MLPKQNRLKNYNAFIATYKNRNIISDDFICMYIGKEKSDLNIDTKIAFVVSKKIHKRAVVRNRIKRLLRESVRIAIKNDKLGSVNKYLSVIFAAKPSSVDASYTVLNHSVLKLFSSVL